MGIGNLQKSRKSITIYKKHTLSCDQMLKAMCVVFYLLIPTSSFLPSVCSPSLRWDQRHLSFSHVILLSFISLIRIDQCNIWSLYIFMSLRSLQVTLVSAFYVAVNKLSQCKPFQLNQRVKHCQRHNGPRNLLRDLDWQPHGTTFYQRHLVSLHWRALLYLPTFFTTESIFDGPFFRIDY